MNTALAVRGITVELGGARILDEVEIDVPAGRWTSVVGPNGAGKTTLLNAVAGMVPLRSGSVDLLGADAHTLGSRARARAVALVPQTPVIPEGVAVLDYALLGRTPHLAFFGRESAADVAFALEMLEQLGVASLSARSVQSLSGGERQRVFLARALLQEAPIVLLDEPTTALDIGHQQDVLELIERLRTERGLAILTTMHDLTLAGLYADELVLLDGGRVAERGVAAEVLTEASLRRHFGARVSVLAGEDGPIVVPSRLAGEGKP